MFFNGHEIGVKAVDKYENYHPVVWMTANDRAGAKNTGLSNDKIMCRITIKTEGKIWRYLPWRAFYDKYNADRSIASTLKQTADDYRNWYVRESQLKTLQRSSFWPKMVPTKTRKTFPDLL